MKIFCDCVKTVCVCVCARAFVIPPNREHTIPHIQTRNTNVNRDGPQSSSVHNSSKWCFHVTNSVKIVCTKLPLCGSVPRVSAPYTIHKSSPIVCFIRSDRPWLSVVYWLRMSPFERDYKNANTHTFVRMSCKLELHQCFSTVNWGGIWILFKLTIGSAQNTKCPK